METEQVDGVLHDEVVKLNKHRVRVTSVVPSARGHTASSTLSTHLHACSCCEGLEPAASTLPDELTDELKTDPAGDELQLPLR